VKTLRRLRRRLREEQGLVTAQFVLVLPVVLFAVVAAVHGGAYLHAQRIVQAAAEDGSAAARASNAEPETGRAVALDTLSQLGRSGVTDVKVTSTRGAEEVVVTVVGRATGPLGPITVRATSSGPIERFRPERPGAR
jgi:Flp pilus assembly protein TadG